MPVIVSAATIELIKASSVAVLRKPASENGIVHGLQAPREYRSDACPDGPFPTCNFPSPEIRVIWPTVTPGMSVIALNAPGVPSNGTPRSRARCFATAFSWGGDGLPKTQNGSEKYREEEINATHHVNPPLLSQPQTGPQIRNGSPFCS